MNFIHYYTDVLKKYVVFTGRASRKEYWMFALWNTAIYIVLFFLLEIGRNTAMVAIVAVIYLLYCLGVFLPSLAVLVRRLHDTNRSGWWILISIVPFIGGLVLLIFSVIDSQPGDNIYGPNPKGVSLG